MFPLGCSARKTTYDDDDDVFLCARFFWSVKWSQTVDDEDSRFLYLGFRIFCFCFFGPKKEEDFLERKKKRRRKVVTKVLYS